MANVKCGWCYTSADDCSQRRTHIGLNCCIDCTHGIQRRKEMGQFAIDIKELENRFGFHPATDETRTKHQNVREGFIKFADELLKIIPEGREKSLVVTALEEASMWANAAIARNLAPLKLGE